MFQDELAEAPVDTALPSPGAMHPIVRALYEHWLAVHPPQGLPGRQHFDPMAVPALLRNVWLLDVERNPYRFRYRVIGSALIEAGTPVRTGDCLHEALPEPARRRNMETFLIRAVETRTPSWRKGKPTIAHQRFVTELEVIALPLARNGEQVDNLLNATVFHWKQAV